MSKRKRERGFAGAAVVFAALGDETRLALLQRLSRDGPASISALAETFDVTRQGVTKHLHVLAAAGVVDGRREGREHVWTLEPKGFGDARRCLDTIEQRWDAALLRLKRHLEPDQESN